MESLFLARDQTLSLWSGSTDSKTIEYQGTPNPTEYQTVRTPTKETTWIQDPASPNHQQHPMQDASSKQQIKQIYRPNHQQTGLPPHSALPIREKKKKNKKKKQANKQTKKRHHKSHHIWSLHKTLHQP